MWHYPKAPEQGMFRASSPTASVPLCSHCLERLPHSSCAPLSEGNCLNFIIAVRFLTHGPILVNPIRQPPLLLLFCLYTVVISYLSRAALGSSGGVVGSRFISPASELMLNWLRKHTEEEKKKLVIDWPEHGSRYSHSSSLLFSQTFYLN